MNLAVAERAAPTRIRGRSWFVLDAVVTGVNAVAYLAAAAVLADHLGSGPGTYRGVGAGLLLFAGAVGAYAARGTFDRRGWAIVAVNSAWVVASLVVAVSGLGDFEALGRTWIALQAIVVAGLTAAQIVALRDAPSVR